MVLARWLPKEDTHDLQTEWRKVLARQPAAHYFSGVFEGLSQLPSIEKAELIETGSAQTMLEHMLANPSFKARALMVCASHQAAMNSGQASMSMSLLTYHFLCNLLDAHMSSDMLKAVDSQLKNEQMQASPDFEKLHELHEQHQKIFNDLIKLGVITSRFEHIDNQVLNFCQANDLKGPKIHNTLRWGTRVSLDCALAEQCDLQTGYIPPEDETVLDQHDEAVTNFIYDTLNAPHEMLRDHLANSWAMRQFFNDCEPELLATHATQVRQQYDHICVQRAQQPDMTFESPPPLRPLHGKDPAVMRHVLDLPAFRQTAAKALASLRTLDPGPSNLREQAINQACEQVARQRLLAEHLRASPVLQQIEQTRENISLIND